MSEAVTVFDQSADADTLSQRVSFADGFQFLDHLPHVGIGLDCDSEQQPAGLAVLGKREFLALNHPLKELRKVSFGLKEPTVSIKLPQQQFQPIQSGLPVAA